MNLNMDALELEFRLTLGFRNCECRRYLIERGKVLLPEVAKEAERRNEDPVDIFADYARGVHRRHEAGLALAVTA